MTETPKSRERPILFSGPMVRAILADRKTQTRRVVKRTPLEWLTDSGFTPEFVASPENHLSPYGHAGDRLWVRETWGWSPFASMPPSEAHKQFVVYAADDSTVGYEFKARPSIHMPRWACRLELDVMDVEIERLQDITPDDCIAEGIEPHDSGDAAEEDAFNRAAYAELWDSINKARGFGWDENPWVWVISFLRAD